MDGPCTAIEQYFNHLIKMRLVSQIVVSDTQGDTTVACLSSTAPVDDTNSSAPKDEYMTVDPGVESNVVISGARCFQNMDQLNLGTPFYINFQYRDSVVVQAVDGCCILTLIGSRSQGHFVGCLLALLHQIRASVVYQELLTKTQECFQ
ncbi:hypothetical protein ERJ75_000869000 [Trypanosoma vivax]|nr:hypothetical protein TRVL_01055 [Trypanosoma vivax]KAH8612580.1 hypothetical protein ERJ75_000869000 [Trypanosoma vivax]